MGGKLTPDETDKACLERVKGFKAIGDVPITNNFYYIFHYIDSSTSQNLKKFYNYSLKFTVLYIINH